MECNTCAAGRYSLKENSYDCIDWKVCDAGTYISINGTNEYDRECTTVLLGHLLNRVINISVQNGKCVNWVFLLF